MQSRVSIAIFLSLSAALLMGLFVDIGDQQVETKKQATELQQAEDRVDEVLGLGESEMATEERAMPPSALELSREVASVKDLSVDESSLAPDHVEGFHDHEECLESMKAVEDMPVVDDRDARHQREYEESLAELRTDFETTIELPN